MTAPTLFTPEAPAAVAAAGLQPLGPVPLVIGLDVAMGISGVAGIGWTDHVRSTADSQHEKFAAQLTGLSSFYRYADFVVIEGAAYSKNNQGADALAAMRWMVRHDLWKRGIPYTVITPSKRITYATGTTVHKDEDGNRLKGEALKALVRAAVGERYGIHTEGRAKSDEADAYVMLAMGLHWLGFPLAEVPARHAAALAGCQWPDREAVTTR
ncbi:hypothetical protein [Streptomyces adelaidensis]|uniref:hypothetical protein n=1 Tax=Streptomyces adelaidensis TaxID=2796465 RepID=UPI0019084FA5|nr:hypothetical protein [Streptomyces adelaidensis]